MFNRTLTTAASIGTGGSGSYRWTIATTQTSGSDYTIKVTSTLNVAYKDVSDASFRVGGQGSRW